MIGYYLKAFHIVFVVTWFAGLFYFVRLLVHYKEADKHDQSVKTALRAQFKKMGKGLWLGITYPSMVLTLIFGFSLVYYYNFWTMPWMHVKFSFVVGLLLYHFYCGYLYNQMQSDALRVSSFTLRVYNELATVFLFGIVFTVVFKQQIFSSLFGVALIALALALLVAVYLFKLKRATRNNEK